MTDKTLQRIFEANAKRAFEIIKPEGYEKGSEAEARDFSVFKTGYCMALADIPRILGVKTVQEALTVLKRRTSDQMVVEGGANGQA